MEEKTVKAVAEVQLGFAFLVDTETAQAASPLSDIPQPRGTRTGARPRGLADVLAVAQVALLEAQLSDLSAQLLPLFEFCEAVLTRALDVMPTRADGPLSAEEYRSLRGIGQAQVETCRHSRRRLDHRECAADKITRSNAMMQQATDNA